MVGISINILYIFVKNVEVLPISAAFYYNVQLNCDNKIRFNKGKEENII